MLKGKVALVTGGSRGIGRAIALAMVQQGADIAVLYAGNTAAAQEVCAQAKTLGVHAKAYPCDVADDAASKAAVESVLADFGGIDILVNNAGITNDKLVPMLEEADFDHVLDVNLKGAFHMIKHTYRQFMKKKAGRIINISSVTAIAGNAGQANYTASKAGLIGLTKTVAKELAGRNVTCNAIAPGFIETDMTSNLGEGTREAFLKSIPLKRFGKAEDVAALAAFLASEAAGYITGEVIKVDGGLIM